MPDKYITIGGKPVPLSPQIIVIYTELKGMIV